MSGGDLRKAITLLQSAHKLHAEDEITLSDVQEIAGVRIVDTVYARGGELTVLVGDPEPGH